MSALIDPAMARVAGSQGMCHGVCVARSAEERALRVGVVIEECAGLTQPVVFNSAGAPALICLPLGWTGAIRDAAIVKMMEILAMRVFEEEDVTEVWRRIADAARQPTPQRLYAGMTIPNRWETYAAD